MNKMRIEFDGGTPCNIPRLGYGSGYGSYRIDNHEVVRLKFNRAMSANAAEIFTLCRGIEAAKELGARHLLLVGDSQIALKWADVAAGNRVATKIKNTSEVFIEAIRELGDVMLGIISVETCWQPRLQSVATFGH